MSQTQQMNMANMGGPVGGPQQMNVGTPNVAGVPPDAIKRLNTAIYDHLLRNRHYETARSFFNCVDIEVDLKKSPNQRQGQQSNGMDDDSMDIDRDRPNDLPAPLQLGEGAFLEGWWCQFWEIHHAQRNRGKHSQATMSYIGAQRQVQKARTNIMAGGNVDPAGMQNVRGYNNMMQMNNGMGMTNDLKKAAMQNPRNMTPQQQMQMQQHMRQQAQNNAQMMQGNPMERSGSQMDMSGPRSGSPGSGDAPSPKRQRLDPTMQPMQQGRPGPPGQMQGNQVGPLSNLPPDSALYSQTQDLLRQKGIDPASLQPQLLHQLAMQPANHQAKAVEAYSSSVQQSMKAAMNQASSNMNKGMPPNAAAMGPGGAQGSPMSQAGMDGATGELYAAANGARMAAMPNAAAAQANNGNHALQDYQMQLMLLEQQNKKRLLMARQEQDSMAHPAGVPGANGQYAPGMSPQGSRTGDPSPNPNDMQRGTPKINKAGMSPNGDMAGRGSPQPGMMHPSLVAPELRQQMMNNGQIQMRPPSSHPMGQQMTPEQIQMIQRGQGMQMPNGAWQAGQGPPPGQQMMPGQQPGGPGQPQPPNMTPRQGNQPMPPPPPPNASGTQPSSPAQAAAPPTPSQTSKAKTGTKKAEQQAKKAAAKKGANQTGATPVSESEAPPTPTPATPITPMHQNSFNHNQNKQLPNGGGPPQQAPANLQPNPNGQPPQQPQQPHQQQQPLQQPQSMAPQQQPPPQDMSGPFGQLGDNDGFNLNGMNMDFANLDGGDVLDNFDFDSFLNTGEPDGMAGFDANFAFGDGLEAGVGGDGMGGMGGQ